MEKCLQLQKELDEAISRQLEEKKRARLEQEWLAAEQVEKERVEQLKKLENEQASIAAAERELALKKQQLHDAEKAAVVEDEEMDGDDGCSDISESTTSQTMVHPSFKIHIHIHWQMMLRWFPKWPNTSRSWKQGSNCLRSSIPL